MNESTHQDPVWREIRILKLYAAGSTMAVVLLFLLAFRSSSHLELETLDVARINVLNESGNPALVIAARGKLPGPWSEGVEYPQELSGGRTRASGMIFFNERGDEVGGLTYSGQLNEKGYSAGGGLTFDQFRQDQVVSLQYQDNGSSRAAGLQVWDRSTEVQIKDLIELLQARRTATGADLEAVQAKIKALSEKGVGAHRVFLGSENRTAQLVLQDKAGRARIRLLVDTLDAARLEFLDAEGNVTHVFPE